MRNSDQDNFSSSKRTSARRASSSDKALTHAQEVRARHHEHSPFPSTASSAGKGNTSKSPFGKQARYVAPSRPVVVRGMISPLPIQKKKPNRPNRRIRLPLNSNGAEVSLPAIFSNLPIGRILIGLVVLGLIAAGVALFKAPTFQVSAAQISGNQRITTDEIEAALQTSGTPTVLINTHALESKLLAAFPDFSSVKVSVGFPAKLKVVVVERTPVLAWVQGDTTLWVDAQGYTFPSHGKSTAKLITVDSSVSLKVPSTTTNALTTATPTTAATTTATTTATAPVAAHPAIAPEVVAAIVSLSKKAPLGVPLLYDNSHGLGWKDPNGWQVYFGSNVSDISVKISEYQAIVAQLKNQGVTPVLISVEYPHAPFYRLEQ